MNNSISEDDYFFLKLIGHPYTGELEGGIQIYQHQNYVEVYNDSVKKSEGYFQKASYTAASNQDSAIELTLHKIKEYSVDLYKYLCKKYPVLSKKVIKLDEDVTGLYKECIDEIQEWWSLVNIAGDMTKDWFSGEGNKDRYFSNDNVALCMKDAKGVNRNRLDFYTKASQAGYIKGMTWSNGAKFGLAGPIYAGLDPIEQFVGSCDIEIKCLDGKTLHFILKNKTSFNSFLYHLGTGVNYLLKKAHLPQTPEWEWERETLKTMGNMLQTYEWDEPINSQLFKKQ